MLNILKKISLFYVFFLTFITISNSSPDLELILKDITNMQKVPAHMGVKEVKYIKEKKDYISKSEIYYLNNTNFKFLTTYPEKFKGNVLLGDGKNFQMYLKSARIKMEASLDRLKQGTAQGQMQIMKGRDNLYLEVDFNNLKKNYETKIIGKEKILNFDTLIIGITSLRTPRTFRKLWVEQTKHFILKEERYYDNKLYYIFFYSSLNFNLPTKQQLTAVIPKNVFSFPAMQGGKGKSTSDYNLAKKLFPQAPFLKTLPQNFYFEKAVLQKGMGVETLALNYSDGVVDLAINKRKKGFLDNLGIFGARIRELLNDVRIYSPFNYYEFDKGENNFVIRSEFSIKDLKELAKSFK